MKFDSALSIVVLPEPVPPEMSVETLPATAAARTSAIAGRKASHFNEPVHVEGRARRIFELKPAVRR